MVMPASGTRRDHSWSSLITTASANRYSSQTRRGIAELTFEKSVASKLRSSGLSSRWTRASGPLGRASVDVRELSPVDARHGVVPPQGRDEAGERAIFGGIGVLTREDEHLAARELRPDVARAAMVELGRGDRVNMSPEPVSPTRASVTRSRIDDDDLDVVVYTLPCDRLEAAYEVGPAVLDRDDDGDHVSAGLPPRRTGTRRAD